MTTNRARIAAAAGISLLVAVLGWMAAAWLLVLAGVVGAVMLGWLAAVWGTDRAVPGVGTRRVASLADDLAEHAVSPVPAGLPHTPEVAAWVRAFDAALAARGLGMEPELVEVVAEAVAEVGPAPIGAHA